MKDKREFTDDYGQHLVNVHKKKDCKGHPCVIHRPSKHSMRAFPLYWRSDRMIFERICPHGIGHPDPDDLAFHYREGRFWEGIHGCDGCCTRAKVPASRGLDPAGGKEGGVTS